MRVKNLQLQRKVYMGEGKENQCVLKSRSLKVLAWICYFFFLFEKLVLLKQLRKLSLKPVISFTYPVVVTLCPESSPAFTLYWVIMYRQIHLRLLSIMGSLWDVSIEKFCCCCWFYLATVLILSNPEGIFQRVTWVFNQV